MRKNNAYIKEKRKKKRFHNFLQSVQDNRFYTLIFIEILLHYFTY